MKVAVIGANGTIGKAIVKKLSNRHEVIQVGHKSGDFRVDFDSVDSIKKLYEKIGSIDAVISAAGNAKFGNFENLTDEDFFLGIKNKLMGQVNLVRLGQKYLKDKGSFTLTSGVLSREPMKGGVAISLVNGAIDAFCKAAAIELLRGIRINVVSPGWVKETMEAMGMDSSTGVPAEKVANAYLESLEGKKSGVVLDARL